MARNGDYDVEFFWDPVCPFAWVTSRWLAKVADQRTYSVDWRLISLKVLNEDKDDLPENYGSMHTFGMELLRVAAAARERFGREPMGPLYTAFGESIWNNDPSVLEGRSRAEVLGNHDRTGELLAQAGLPSELAAAASEPEWDEVLRAETADALSRTGDDLGTPIITFFPDGEDDSVSFFGPVISRIPDDDEALRLWDAVLTLAEWPGFAELKRSLREMPQIPLLAGMS